MVQVKNEFEELNSVEEMYDYLKDREYYSRQTYDYMYPLMSQLYEGRGFRLIDLLCIFVELNSEEVKNANAYLSSRRKYRVFNLDNGNKLYCMERD